MKLLVVVDTEEYSQRAAQVAAQFAMNAWADVTLLAFQASNTDAPRPEVVEALEKTRKRFLGPDSPYGKVGAPRYEAAGAKAWVAEEQPEKGQKRFRTVIRRGDPGRGIIEQVREEEADFLVLGASQTEGEWVGESRLPQKVASGAPCSSLVVKGSGTGNTLTCCLDEAGVSQESLEIINQLVTTHKAELKIVGLTGARGLREKVEERLTEVLRYYATRNIRAWVRLVDAEELPAFARDASRTGMLGIWLGETSLLARIFSKDRLEQLVRSAESSVVILK